jgi:WD40 repeat protein
MADFIAVSAERIAHVWDITGSEPHLIETFTGHTDIITSLAFSSSSSLISASVDQSVKFWKIGAMPTDLVGTDSKSTSTCTSHNHVYHPSSKRQYLHYK